MKMATENILTTTERSKNNFIHGQRGPGGRDDKGKSAFPPAHCAEVGVVSSNPANGQLVMPWVYLCDLSCVVKISCCYFVWCCNL